MYCTAAGWESYRTSQQQQLSISWLHARAGRALCGATACNQGQRQRILILVGCLTARAARPSRPSAASAAAPRYALQSPALVVSLPGLLSVELFRKDEALLLSSSAFPAACSLHSAVGDLLFRSQDAQLAHTVALPRISTSQRGNSELGTECQALGALSTSRLVGGHADVVTRRAGAHEGRQHSA